MRSLSPITLSEFAARVAIHGGGPGSILALVDDHPARAAELCDELSVFSDQQVHRLSVGDTAGETIARLAEAEGGLVVLTGIDTLSSADWAELDQLQPHCACCDVRDADAAHGPACVARPRSESVELARWTSVASGRVVRRTVGS